MLALFLMAKSLMGKKRPTKRAVDLWDSARFTGIFLASGFSCSQTLSTPAHTQVTQTVETVEKVGGYTAFG